MPDNNDTLADRLSRACKNHPLIAPFVVAVAFLTAVGGAFQGIQAIAGFWNPTKQEISTPRPLPLPTPKPAKATPIISTPLPATTPPSTPRLSPAPVKPLGWIEFGTFDATTKRWARPKLLDHTFFNQLPNLKVSDTFTVIDDVLLEEQPLGGRMLGWILKGTRVRIDQTHIAIKRKENKGLFDNRDYQLIAARVTEIMPATGFKPK